MDLATTEIDVETAKAKVEEYRDAVRASQDAEDRQILRGYEAIVKGNPVISLTATLGTGGRHDNGLPKLAVCRADAEQCWLETCTYDGRVVFTTKRMVDGRNSANRADIRAFVAGTLPAIEPRNENHHPDSDCIVLPKGTSWGGGRSPHSSYSPRMRAIVPKVPPRLRPGHHLRNYEILWEVDRWEIDPKAPVDPALLKHIGGDLYAVVAVWDLTDLERLVLEGRKS